MTPNICNELNVSHRLQNEHNMSIEIRLYLNSHYPVSVYSCSETLLSSNILDHHFSIEGSAIIRRDRISKEGGGLIVYIQCVMAMPPNILIMYVISSKLTMSIKCIYI